MKNFILFYCICIFSTICISCSKSKTPLNVVINDTTKNVVKDSGCGCNTDTIFGYTTYHNFFGYDYDGILAYEPTATMPGWFVELVVIDPTHNNENNEGFLKICNPDLPALKAFTDTSSHKYSIPIRFAGSVKKLCNSEVQNFGLTTIPEVVFFYVTIDSLIKK